MDNSEESSINDSVYMEQQGYMTQNLYLCFVDVNMYILAHKFLGVLYSMYMNYICCTLVNFKRVNLKLFGTSE